MNEADPGENCDTYSHMSGSNVTELPEDRKVLYLLDLFFMSTLNPQLLGWTLGTNRKNLTLAMKEGQEIRETDYF